MEQRNTFSTKTEETKKRAGSERTLWARFYQYVKPYRKNLTIGAVCHRRQRINGADFPLPSHDCHQQYHYTCGANR